MTETQVVPYDDHNVAPAALMQVDTSKDLGAVAKVAREQAEQQAAIICAKQFPRDEAVVWGKIERAVARPRLAEAATYSFPRGGAVVSGPSVVLARELARLWGNLRHGLRILAEDDETVTVEGWAYDCESNSSSSIERRIPKAIQRKNRRTGETEWVTPDARDQLERISSEGAKCVRNAILELIPGDFKDQAIEWAHRTNAKAAAGKLEEDRENTIRGIVAAFARYGVMRDDLEKALGHPVEQLTPDELADLREKWRSIKDGASSAAELFPREAGTAADVAQDELKKAAKKKTSRRRGQQAFTDDESPEDPG